MPGVENLAIVVVKPSTSGTRNAFSVRMFKESMNDVAKKPTILVVDDDDYVRLSLIGLLKASNFETIAVRNVDEAITVLSTTPDISLVLLDWYLPGSQDTTAARVLDACRQRERWLPVVVLSGHLRSDVRSDALLGTADSFVSKPFSNTVLLSHIKWIVGRVETANACFQPQEERDVQPLEVVKGQYVSSVVKICGNNISRAADLLQVHRHTVNSLLLPESKAKGVEDATIAKPHLPILPDRPLARSL